MDVQKLTRQVADSYLVAHKYYQVLSVINDLKLADGEITLMAFTAIEGNISDPALRKVYCKKYKTTIATINNIVHRLKKRNLLKKDGKMIFVNPTLNALDFQQKITLLLTIDVPEKIEKPNLLNVQKYG